MKTIDENLYNEKTLYLLNVRELRDIGRKLGVPAPATLKKQELVDYILKIVYGEIDIPKRNSCGRPNTRNVDINHCIEKIMKKTDVNDELLSASLDIGGIFKVASPTIKSQTKNVEQRIFVEDDGKFYLRQYGFVASDSDIEVSKNAKERYNLTNFDVVEAIISGKTFKIVSINGQIIENENKIQNMEDSGTKQVFHFCTKEEIKQEIDNIIEKNLKNNIKTVIFSAEDFSKRDVVFVKTDKSQSNDQAYKNFMSFVNTCEKFVFDGEIIVVVTDQSDFIENVVESFDEEVATRIKKHLQLQIDDFLALGNVLYVFKLDEEAIYQ